MSEKLTDDIEEMDLQDDGPPPETTPEEFQIPSPQELARKNIRNNVAMGIFTAHVNAKGLPTGGDEEQKRRIIDDNLMKAFYAAEVWVMMCEESLAVAPPEEVPKDGGKPVEEAPYNGA